MEYIEALLSALGLKFKVAVAGAVAAFVSLRFFEGLSPWERWMTFLGGWAMAAYLAEPVTLYLELPGKVDVGISLVIGLFGMSIAAAVVKVIRDTSWGDFLSQFRRKPGGDA